jgi:hypothetical protein
MRDRVGRDSLCKARSEASVARLESNRGHYDFSGQVSIPSYRADSSEKW